MEENRSSEILGKVFEKRHLFRVAVMSLNREDRVHLIDELAASLQKKAIDVSGFVKMGGWPQVEAWCAGEHLCVVMSEVDTLPRSSGSDPLDLLNARLAQGGPWHQLVFSLSPRADWTASQWLSRRLKEEETRARFLAGPGEAALDPLCRGEHLALIALSAKPLASGEAGNK